jgi:hypothetical protein
LVLDGKNGTQIDNKWPNYFSNTNLKVLNKLPNTHEGGLVLRVENALSQEMPLLSIEICAYKKTMKKDSDRSTSEDDRLCFGSKAPVTYNGKLIYHLDKVYTEQLLQKARDEGSIRVKFNDSHSRSSRHWRCYENEFLKVKDIPSITQYFDIIATQINNFSYSCLVESF